MVDVVRGVEVRRTAESFWVPLEPERFSEDEGTSPKMKNLMKAPMRRAMES